MERRETGVNINISPEDKTEHLGEKEWRNGEMITLWATRENGWIRVLWYKVVSLGELVKTHLEQLLVAWPMEIESCADQDLEMLVVVGLASQHLLWSSSL